MRYSLGTLMVGALCMIFLAISCKKSSSEFNYSVGLTGAFGGSTQQYVTPAGVVDNGTETAFSISGYETKITANTMQLTIDTVKTDSFQLGNSVNALVVVNNGVTYSTNYSAPYNGNGMAYVTVNGHKVTGTFSGTLYTASFVNPKQTLVVTNGTINTTY